MRLMEFSFLNIKELFALIFSIIALIFYTPVQEIAFENRQGNWSMSTNSKIIIYSPMQVSATREEDGHYTYRRMYKWVYEGKGQKWRKTASTWDCTTKSQSETIQQKFSFLKILAKSDQNAIFCRSVSGLQLQPAGSGSISWFFTGIYKEEVFPMEWNFGLRHKASFPFSSVLKYTK